MNSKSNWWSLDWFGAKHYWRYYQWMEKVSPSRAHIRGPTFQTFL